MELQNKLKDLCINRAYSLYGYNYPSEIDERLNAELDVIKKNETANIFLLLQKISEYSHLKGYDIMCAGRLAGSFAAFLGGISSINPLKPHFYCPYCKKIEFVSADYTDICYDLPDKQCTVCGHKLQKAGWNIPFEKSLSCFEICVAPEVYDEIIRKFSNTDSSIMINSFGEKCAENKSVRLNILKSDALSLLGNLKKKVPINSGDINLSDFKILEFLSQSDNMHEILSLLNWDADCYKLNMKIHSFYDILHFISLANGKYRKEMPSDFPATGDDIMLYLMSQGIPAKYACSISLHASKGGLSQAEIDILKKYNTEPQIIDYFKQIIYLFPKAHICEFTDILLKTAWYKVNFPEIF
ncbi:MAG: hypothetical protein ACI4RN_01555 [Oscillospiraceae bacterium]